MKGNAVYYKEVVGVMRNGFPREETVAYVERDQDEEALLDSLKTITYLMLEEDSEPEKKFRD